MDDGDVPLRATRDVTGDAVEQQHADGAGDPGLDDLQPRSGRALTWFAFAATAFVGGEVLAVDGTDPRVVHHAALRLPGTRRIGVDARVAAPRFLNR